ncbi:MAG: serine/threonine-protein kinase, partial [archaeon]|nr:serine/threonine-protein kinase [archaeon]
MEKYEPLTLIGKGNFGTIMKIRRKADNKILVWKEIDYSLMEEKDKAHIISEINILRELKNPNIVKYYEHIIDKSACRIFIIMEYCQGGDLSKIIKNQKRIKEYLKEELIWKIFTQVCLALYACHLNKTGKILHRDLKPSNVFLDEYNNVKLGDFGLSKLVSTETNFVFSNVGTPYYMSPEQLDECGYDEKCDIWSLGCFLYELCCLRPPFEAKSHLSLAMKIKAGQYPDLPSFYSEELRNLVKILINVSPKYRPSIIDVVHLPCLRLRIKEKKIKEGFNRIKLIEDNLAEREKI